jgi:hypothetical protein
MLNGKNLEGGSHGLFEGNNFAFSWINEEISIRIASNPTAIQTRYLTNTSLKFF